ncbi:MAG: cytochrome C peroxidase [Proteobacteria bacterium]|nr:MAG: cytochrome C peroxidase [Pseudomonadota bacterium]
MALGSLRALLSAAFLAGAAAGGFAALAAKSAAAPDLGTLKSAFRRPPTVPFPPDNSFSEAKRRLGEKLFHDKALSVDGSTSCATCHIREKGLADGRERGQGVSGQRLGRHTPALWNLAWSYLMFWDGRAQNLEQQAFGPIESPDEMAQPKAQLIAKLSANPEYRRAFAEAFPRNPQVTDDNLAKALATYERTLVSPLTRFDRWIEGDDGALNAREIDGFKLFTGKAGCANCHTGFAFTDGNFYDVGLPDADRGRGAVLRLPAADHAFKTPGLRELARSAPYMHDGSLATVEDVLRHYENGVVERSTVAPELARKLSLSDEERAALIAFLATLSSDSDPLPPTTIAAATSGPAQAAVPVTTISQHEKQFSPAHVRVTAGSHLWILNNDSRTHNVRVFDPKLEFDSGAQEPGETVEIAFPKTGSFLVFCGIHPKMELYVDVTK